MNKRRITINDIAAHAGVSRSTVSLVLQKNSRIPEATGEKVRQSIAALGYTYNRNAANLRSRTSHAIGLVINDIRNPFFAELASAVEERAEEAGYMVYLVESGEQPERQDRLLESFVEHDVAGLIVCVATGTPPHAFDRFLERGIPICVAVRPYPDARLDYAGADNYGGALMATQHLIDLGHRRIAFLGGERENPVRTDRLAGYFAGLGTRGIDFDPALVVESRPSLTNAMADVQTVLGLDVRPTAMLCYNDLVAMGVMHALRCAGLTPGEQIAVVGFDGMPETEITHPPLSTVQVYGRKMGNDAADLLISRIEDPTRLPTRRVEQATLIVRASSGKPL